MTLNRLIAALTDLRDTSEVPAAELGAAHVLGMFPEGDIELWLHANGIEVKSRPDEPPLVVLYFGRGA